MSRKLGSFRHQVVASPSYLAAYGTPMVPEDLLHHKCLHHRYPSTGKLEQWPLSRDGVELRLDLPATTIASTIEPLIHLAENGFGVTCLPPFAVKAQLANGSLRSLLEDYLSATGTFRILWPTSRYLSPKTRVFVDFMAVNLFVR